MALFDAANALDQTRLTESAVDAMTADAPPADLDEGSAGPVPGEALQAQQSDESQTPSDTSTADTFAGLDVPADIKPGLDAIGASLAQAGISNSGIEHTAAWLLALQESRGEDIGHVEPRHKYQVEHRFTSEQQPYVSWFLNAASAAKIPQSEIDGILTWWKTHEPKFAQQSAAAYRQVEALDLQDRAQAGKVMREEWGNEYANNVRLLNGYLDNLPAAAREQIERGTIDGRRGLNDPERLRELAKLARGGSESRAEIEKLMGDRYSKYWKGPDAERLQARYRDMLRET